MCVCVYLIIEFLRLPLVACPSTKVFKMSLNSCQLKEELQGDYLPIMIDLTGWLVLMASNLAAITQECACRLSAMAKSLPHDISKTGENSIPFFYLKSSKM